MRPRPVALVALAAALLALAAPPLSGAAGAYARRAAMAAFVLPQTALPRGPSPLRLEIEQIGPARVGEPFPLALRLRNVSDAPVLALPDLDGSSTGWRFPDLRVVAIGPDGAAREDRSSSCGWMNALRPDDFVELAPGEALALGQWSQPLLDWLPAEAAGIWTLRITYDSAPYPRASTDLLDPGLGRGEPYNPAELAAVLRLLQRAPWVRLEETIQIVVR